MHKSLLSLFFTFVSTAALALDVSIYETLKQDLYELHRHQNHESVASLYRFPLLNKLRDLKITDSDHAPLYGNIEVMVLRDDAPIKFGDLVEVLKALDFHLSHSERAAAKEKAAELFADLLTAKKEVQNVVVTGRTRVGKSTILATIMDPLNPQLKDEISQCSLFSHTENSKHYWRVFDSCQNGFYVARLIDTPGLNEVKPIGVQIRSDEEIIKNIASSLQGIQVHKVLQIFPLSSSGLNPSDISAFTMIRREFSERNIFNGKIDMIFPRADTMNLSNLKHLVSELFSIFAREGGEEGYVGAKLYSGTVLNNDFDLGYLDATLSNARKALSLRNRLLQHIFDAPFLEYLHIDKGYVVLSAETEGTISAIIPSQENHLEL